MRIKLSNHFSYGRLLRFTLPSIIMMVFTSIYGMVDGLFVSNVAGITQFAAINLVMPVLMICGSIGFMFGAGGTAIVSQTLGEGRLEDAKKYFTLITVTTAILGVIFSVAGIILMPTLSTLLGAEGELHSYCVLYGRVLLMAMPAFMLQNLFQSFFIAAEKPKLGLFVTVGAGITNIVLDALFVWFLKLDLAGAAIATAISQIVGAVAPLVYFSRKNDSLLAFSKFKFYGKVLIKSVTNGSSELMSNISMSVVTVLYNSQLMEFAGEDGIAAYGAMMYLGFFFVAIFIGYSIGSAPIIGFHYGAKCESEVKSILRKSAVITFSIGALMTLIGVIFATPLSSIFVSSNQALLAMTSHGMRIYSMSFFVSGFCIFSSSFFTALGNGPTSAAISFMRTFVYQVVLVLILPIFFELEGIWYSMLVAEILSVLTSFAFLFINNKRYHYL